MIRFRCDGCGHGIGVADMHAGRKGRCPKCRQIVRVPAAAQEETAWNGVITKADLRRGLAYAIAAHAATGWDHDGHSCTQRCPHCGGTILAGTIKCMHCGTPLYETWRTDPARGAKKKPSDSDLGVPVPFGLAAVLPPACAAHGHLAEKNGQGLAELVEPLFRASGWIRGVALASIVLGALWGLFGLVLLVGGPPTPLARHGNVTLGLALGYLGGGAVSIYLGTLLYQAAGRIRRSHDFLDAGLLRDGLKKLSAYFVALGIIVLLGALLCFGVGFASALYS